MAVTDQQAINLMIYRLLENGAADANLILQTAMFSQQQIIDALNRAQQQFLVDTGLIVSITQFPSQVGQPKYDLPTNCIRPRRFTWTGDTP